MSEDFVNRHGHKVSGSLEAPPGPEPSMHTPRVVPKPVKVKRVKPKKPVKKILTILTIVFVAVALLPLVTGESVRANYVTSRDNAKAQLVEFATKTVVPQQKKQVTLAQLSENAVRVEKIRDDLCDGGFMDNLAMLYPRAKEAYDRCIAQKQKIAVVAASLRDLESQVRYINSIAPILGPVAKPAAEEFAIISTQLENWRAFSETLSKLSPAASQRAAHDKLKTQSKAIVDAWSALNTANNNQEASAFANAEKELVESYEAFRASGVELAAVMNDTQTKLTASYKAL